MQGNTQQSYRRRSNTFNVEKEVLNVARNKLEEYVNDANDWSIKCTCEVRQAYKEHRERAANGIDELDKPDFTLWQKFSIFFDLDLLKDFTYINIMIGVTIANFAELNFSVLTPFVLADFGFDKSQIALCMSLLGMTDISVRFFIPFIAGFIGWENRTFFLFGVLGMALGRVGKKLQFFRNSTASLQLSSSFSSSTLPHFLLRPGDLAVDWIQQRPKDRFHGPLYPFACPARPATERDRPSPTFFWILLHFYGASCR